MKQTESDILRAICDYLELRGWFFWRQNTAPAVQKTGDRWAFRRMPKHSMKGVPDIILIDRGQFVGLEVKTKEGRQSLEQHEFEERVLASGGRYHVVRSIDDVVALGF